MPLYKDQLKREVEIVSQPRRIVSLVPSKTELLYDLGLDERVIGITKFCVHPEAWFRNKPRVGGTKTVNIEAVAALQPDLIIANKEENVKEQIDALEKIAPVWVSDVDTIEEALDMIGCIGDITATKEAAHHMIGKIKDDLRTLSSLTIEQRFRTAYFIWKDPYMVAGSDTFISDVLRIAGLDNVFHDRLRYPSVTIQEIAALDTQLVLLSSEPYPFQQKHIDELQSQLPHARIELINGEIFSWYGSRMLKIKDYLFQLRELLNP